MHTTELGETVYIYIDDYKNTGILLVSVLYISFRLWFPQHAHDIGTNFCHTLHNKINVILLLYYIPIAYCATIVGLVQLFPALYMAGIKSQTKITIFIRNCTIMATNLFLINTRKYPLKIKPVLSINLYTICLTYNQYLLQKATNCLFAVYEVSINDFTFDQFH